MNQPHPEPADSNARDWAVWRIDDNGNTFVIREHLDRAEAERLVEEFTARGHKQTYWAERETGGLARPSDVRARAPSEDKA